jgi:small GTP-binding protein
MMSKRHLNKPTPLKVLIIGNSGVGKSSILLRFADGTFNVNYTATIGIDFKIKNIVVNNKDYKLQIWDSAGQERFKTLTINYFRGAMGIILVYDVTRRETFDAVEGWMEDIHAHCDQPTPVVLVGNKCDMLADSVISRTEGKELAEKYDVFFFDCSSKNGINVDDIFNCIAKEIVRVRGNALNLKVSSESSETTKLVELKDSKDNDEYWRNKCCK